MGRQALDEKGHGVVDRGRLDQVVVVEGEDERGRVALEVGDQARHDGLGGRAGGGLEEHLRSGPDPRRSPPDRGDEVGEEVGQVVVGGVEGEPGGACPSGPSRPAASSVSHWASSVVLPKPAGAATRTSRGRWSGSGGPGPPDRRGGRSAGAEARAAAARPAA